MIGSFIFNGGFFSSDTLSYLYDQICSLLHLISRMLVFCVFELFFPSFLFYYRQYFPTPDVQPRMDELYLRFICNGDGAKRLLGNALFVIWESVGSTLLKLHIVEVASVNFIQIANYLAVF